MPIEFSNSNDFRDSDDQSPIDVPRILDDRSNDELSVPALLEKILNEQRALAASPTAPTVEDYLDRFPVLKTNPESILDLIYNEFLVRREITVILRMEPPTPAEYLSRFPDLASALNDQFQLYMGLDSGLIQENDGAEDRQSDIIEKKLIGQVIKDRYEIQECLGEGGFAIVYKAQDVRLRRTVAIKVSRYAFEPNSKQSKRFVREAESIAKLSHPGILQVHEVGEIDNRPFIVGQLAEGGSLASRLQDSRFDEATTVNWMIEICDAVEYSHQFGIVHRDLKPANILFHSQSAMIADFGLASMAESEVNITLQGELVGTPAYMSPEQARSSSNVTAACDQYSLGVIFYQCLTGKLPFEGSASQLIHQTLHAEPPPPRSIQGNISLDLQTICLKALAKSPEQRYSSVREMAADLRRFQAHEPIQARPIGWTGKLKRWCIRQPALAATLLASTILLLAISWISFDRITTERDRFRSERDRANTQLYASLISNAENNIAAKPTGWWQNAYDALIEAKSLSKTPVEISGVRELMVKLLVDDSRRLTATNDHYKSSIPATALFADPLQRFVAVGTRSGTIQIRSYDLRTLLMELSAESNSRPVHEIRVLATTNQLIALIGDQVWTWKLEADETKITGKSSLPLLLAEQATSISSSPDESKIIVAVPSKALFYEARQIDSGSRPTAFDTFEIGNTAIESIAFFDPEPTVVFGLADSTIQVWSLEQSRQTHFKKIPWEPVRHVAVWRDNIIWTDSTSFTTYFWNPRNGRESKTNLLPSAVNGVSIIGDAPVCTTTEGRIYVISAFTGLTGSPTTELSAGGFGELISTSKDNRNGAILAAYRDGRVQRWKIEKSDYVHPWNSTQPLSLAEDDLLFNHVTATNVIQEGQNETKFSVSSPAVFHPVVDGQTNDLFCIEGRDLICRRGGSGQIERLENVASSPVISVSLDSKTRQLFFLEENGVVVAFRLADLSILGKRQLPSEPATRLVAFDGDLLLLARGQIKLLTKKGLRLTSPISNFFDIRGVHSSNEIVAVYNEKKINVFRFGEWERPIADLKSSASIRFCTIIRDISTSRPSLAAIDANSVLTVWDIESQEITQQFKLSENAKTCHFDPLGKFLVVSMPHGTKETELYELNSGKLIAQLEATSECNNVQFNADGKSILVVGRGVMEVERSELEAAYRQASELESDAPPVRIDCKFNYAIPGAACLHVWSVDVSPNGRWHAATGQDRCVRIREIPDHRITQFLTEHDDVVWSCDFSDDSMRLATGSVREGRGEVIVWDTQSWKPIRSLFVGSNLISGIQFHPSLPLLAASCFDGTAWLLNYETGETIKQLLPKGARAMDIDFSTDGQYLAIAETSSGASVFKIDQVGSQFKCQLYKRIKDDNERIWTLSFARDRKILYTATQSGLIRIYSFPALETVATIETSGAGFRQMKLSSDGGKLVLSAWPTGAGQILDLGKLRGKLAGLGLDW